MKTLFLCEGGLSDFGMDPVWAGLVAKLGRDNLMGWPLAPRFRLAEVDRTASIKQQYTQERASMCFTPQNPTLPEWTLEDVQRIVRTEGLERVFLDETQRAYELYRMAGLDKDKIPVVVIAGSDSLRTGRFLSWYGNNLEAAFLDNWIPAHAKLPRCYPSCYAMSNLEQFLTDREAAELQAKKLYDVCFIAANTHGERTKHFEALKAAYPKDAEAGALTLYYKMVSGLKFVEGDPPIMLRREYLTKMAQARVCINVAGAAVSGKTIRFFEIPWVGSLMVTTPVSGLPWPLVNGVHCLCFRTIPEMMERVRWALSHPQEAAKIAATGYHFVRSHYGAAQKIEYIYSKLGGHGATN